jgi:hypothetical protein
VKKTIVPGHKVTTKLMNNQKVVGAVLGLPGYQTSANFYTFFEHMPKV